MTIFPKHITDHQYISDLEEMVKVLDAKNKQLTSPKPIKSISTRRNDRCPECGLPYSECDPEGIGHYRG